MWQVLESIPNQRALASQWRERLGQDHEAFAQAFLAPTERRASSVPCTRCGCLHEVVDDLAPTPELCGDATSEPLHAVCRCDPWRCEDLLLAPDDLRVFELSWTRLSRALCSAFGLEPRSATISGHRTRQVGAWSGGAVPVLLTVQPHPEQFRSAVAELVGRLRRPFMLLSPTLAHLDARALELLESASAACFALESTTHFDRAGRLRATQEPAELFARFAPQRPAPDEDVARKAMAMVQQLEKDAPFTAPSVMQVFRLYCMEALSASEVAGRCRCSKTSVMRRLNCIRQRTGFSADRLRQFSSQFASLEENLGDPRAEHIHRRKLIYDQEEEP